MYRPEGFYERIWASPFARECRDSPALVEFIADAMLGALRKVPVDSALTGYTLKAGDRKYMALFLPEDE